MAAARDLTTRLPLEVHRIWLGYLPKSDLKTTRLLNKALSAIANTVLWYHLKIDIAKSDVRKLDALLDSGADSILCNIRKLEITTPIPNSSPKWERASTRLLDLLIALPRDSLNMYICPMLSHDRSLLGVLLRTQTQLRELTFAMHPRGLFGIRGTAYIRDNLTNLHKIKILVSSSEYTTYRGLAKWFPHAPVLKELWIEGKSDHAYNDFDGWDLSMTEPPLKLHTLSLKNLTLSGATASLAKLLDLPYLESLCFEECSGTAPMLLSLAKRYQNITGYALKTFTYKVDTPSPSEKDAFVELVQSFEVLQALVVGVRGGTLPGFNDIKHAGKLLQDLGLYGHVYTALELEQLVASFPQLKKLCLDFGDFAEAVDSLEPFEPYLLSTNGQLERSLGAIARHPMLVSLEHTGRPLLQGGRVRERRWRYAQVAEQMVQHLDRHGSTIESLSFAPGFEVVCPEDIDEDGNSWPYYSFKRAYVVVKYTGTHGEQVVKTSVSPRGAF